MLLTAKHGDSWDDDGIRAMALCMAAEELEADRQEGRARSYPLPPDTPAGTVAGARQKALWEVKIPKERVALALQHGTATSSATEPGWGAGTVDSARQGWGCQVGSPPDSAALAAEALRMTASASSRGQSMVQAATPQTVAGSTVAQALQTAPEATSWALAPEAPALVPSAQVQQAVDTSPGKPEAQPGQKQQTPPFEPLQASSSRPR